MIDLKDQTFGMELEFTGITREKAASVLAEYFGGRIFENDDDYYTAYGVYSSDNRRWNIVRDCSINPVGYEVGDYDEDYQCELVTPICKYEDIETVQEIVRELKKAGAKVNGSCGLHVHIGGDKHDVQSLTRLSFKDILKTAVCGTEAFIPIYLLTLTGYCGSIQTGTDLKVMTAKRSIST
jgi:hypothetical protein